MNNATQEARRHAPIDLARDYKQRGWSPLPYHFATKRPMRNGWPEPLTDDEIEQCFAQEGEQNVGVLLGAPSGGLIDIDLDCPQAIAVAPFFLPSTLTFGRAGARRSHWLFTTTAPEKRTVLRDPTMEQKAKGAVLVELRSTGDATVFPGSVHVSGEAIEWTKGDPAAPATIVVDELIRGVRKVAAAALLAKHWPAKGGRHAASLAINGGLQRDGWSEDEASDFLVAVTTAALDEEAEDRSADATTTAERLHDGRECTGWRTAAELIGKRVIDAIREWLGLALDRDSNANGEDGDGGESPKERKKVAARLLALTQSAGVELFHSKDKGAYALVPINQQHEVMSLRSEVFRLWLTNEFYDAEETTATRQAYSEAIDALKARAIHRGAEHDVFLRVARVGSNVVLDLGDAERRHVVVTPAGWKVAAQGDVRFRRAPGMTALSVPEPGGSIELLRPFLNLADETSFHLVVSWLVMALGGRGPYPILNFVGEQGSSKSTASRVLRDLVDPSSAPIRSRPRDERDLAISASNGHVLAFDNLSGLSPEFSDSLCRVATGGAISTRVLYTDSDEQIFVFKRPMVLNGITDLAERPDFAERSIVVRLPRLCEANRRDEAAFWADFDSVRPRILGALLDGVRVALARFDSVKLAKMPRMADFIRWSTAAEPAFGWPDGTVLRAHALNQAEATHGILAADDLAFALESVLAANDDEWVGTLSELLPSLDQHLPGRASRARDWPKDAASLGKRLLRLKPALRALRIEVIEPKSHKHGRRYTIRRTPVPRVPSVLSAAKTAGSEGTAATEGTGAAPLAGTGAMSRGPDGSVASGTETRRNGSGGDAGDRGDGKPFKNLRSYPPLDG